MTKHVKGVVKEYIKIVKLKKKDSLLEIASMYVFFFFFKKKNIFRVGIDPLIKKYKNQYKNINFGIQEFFSYKAIQKKKSIKNSRSLQPYQCFMIYRIRIGF